MRYITFLLLTILFYSCDSDDNESTVSEPPNILTIKRINDIGINNERVYYFDSNGRLDSITDTEALPEYNNLLSKYEYSTDGKLVSSYHTYGSEDIFFTLDYDNTAISNFYYSTFGSSTDSPIITINNTLTYVDEDIDVYDQDDLNVELTFSSNTLEYVTQRESDLINDSNSTWELTDFEYDSNFNLIQTNTTVRFGSVVELIETSTYDDKKNPIAESMSNYRLPLYFLSSFYPIDMSPNNVISKTNAQYITLSYEYLYNNDNYPTSATVTNTNTNEVTNTLTYTYY